MKTRDELMIDEAIGRAEATCPVGHDIYPHIARHTLDLERMNWQPPTDPDLIEAREWLASFHDNNHNAIWAPEAREGKYDHVRSILGFMAGIKRGRELERGGK